MAVAGAIALALVLAGCLGEPGDLASPDQTLIETTWGPYVQDGDQSANWTDWFLVDMETGPHRPFAAFEWQMPEGYDSGSGSRAHLAVLPLAQDWQALETWGILSFNRTSANEGTLQVVAGMIHPIWNERRSILDPEAERHGPYDVLFPFTLPVGDDGVARLVVMTGSTENQRAGLALRLVTQEDLPTTEDLGSWFQSMTLDDFVSESSGTGHLLSPRAEAEGFGAAMYENGATRYGRLERWTDDVSITWNPVVPSAAWPVAVHDVRIASELGGGEGYGFFGTGLSSAGGHYELDVDIRGATLSHSGVSTPYAPLVEIVTGRGFAVAQGGGAGASSAMLTLKGISAPAPLDLIAFTHVDLGAPLEFLFGMPAGEYTWAWDGIIDLPSSELDRAWLFPSGPHQQ